MIEGLKIGIVGLGYVGLPLAIEFGKHYETVGFDIDSSRIKQLLKNIDCNEGISASEFNDSKLKSFTDNFDDLRECNFYVVTVPTPVDVNNRPDMSFVIEASRMLSKVLVEGDHVVYESTVYPGATEEECLPILEKSGLSLNKTLFLGYSPERINPGDKENKLRNIVKIVSGSNQKTSALIADVYSQIIDAGVHVAPSIKVAESAKLIENIQRDVNIALVNELFQIFNRLNINTNDVIEAASTKWNFMKLKPGLVGGHCISVDPYYMLSKSQSVGYVPDLIKLSREINNSMSSYIVNDFKEWLGKKNIIKMDLTIGVLGFSFKENCGDIRNTKAIEVISELKSVGFELKIYDSKVSKQEVKDKYNIDVLGDYDDDFDVGIVLVPHDELVKFFSNSEKPIYDFKDSLKS